MRRLTVIFFYGLLAASAWAYAPERKPVRPEHLRYIYDPAGNLLRRTNHTLVQTFGNNALNQLTNVTRSGLLTVSGVTPAPASSVTVNGQPANRYADFTFARTNVALTGNDTFQIVATRSGATVTNTLAVSLPASVTLLYDRNGNLTNDGLRNFSYDAENQLTTNWVAGAWKQEFGYDGFGRKRIERTYGWQTNQWVQTNEVRWVWDGMLPLQERNSTNGVLVTYTRGLNLSGSLQGAGGIGGLLARTQPSTTGPQHAYYHADGAGNVTALLDARNNIAARYAYDPFGRQLAQWGPMAEVNRYRFSSKEWNPLGGMPDFGGRWYRPDLGRWLSADPSGEGGGINLYRFNFNNPLVWVDPDGLAPQLVSVTYNPQTGSTTAGYVNEKFGDSLRRAKARPFDDPTLVRANQMFETGAELSYDPNASWTEAAPYYLMGAGLTILGVLEMIPDAGVLTKPAGKAACKAAAEGIAIPSGRAVQATTAEARAALAEVQNGATVYRQGWTGTQRTFDAQNWALQNPATTPNFANQLGMPATATEGEYFWMMGGRVTPGAPVITRPAPGIGANVGGSMEAVVNPGGVRIDWFHMP